MEVSSHALAQKRIYKILYDAAGWTSFSQDHLDYHQSKEEYFKEKTKLPLHYLKNKNNFFISIISNISSESIKKNKISFKKLLHLISPIKITKQALKNIF